MATKISIYRDGVWAGDGRVVDGEIVDCPAMLGPDNDASEDTYEALCDAMDEAPQDADRYTGEGSVERPDGTYSYVLSEA